MEVYLDNSATTKCYESVREIVGKVMCEDYGNPSSMHKKGVDAEKYIKESKETLAKLLKVQEKEIYFTSGGTESDNLALIGCARANHRSGKTSDHIFYRTSGNLKYDALSGGGRRISSDIPAGG